MMSNLTISRTEIPDVICFVPRRFGDARGWFSETYSTHAFSDLLGGTVFVQDNQSYSAQARHGARPALPVAARRRRPSLSACLQGSVYDVAVDLRVGSPTYGRCDGATLTAAGREQLFVPRGFAHAFCTLEPDTDGRLQG